MKNAKERELKLKSKSPVGAICDRPKMNKGITLIALVITIIIMLILVVVTVSYGIKSGLLGKAKDAKNKTEISNVNEYIQMRYAELSIDDRIKEDFKNKIVGEVVEKYGCQITNVILKNNGLYYKLSLDGKTYHIDKKGQLKESNKLLVYGNTVNILPNQYKKVEYIQTNHTGGHCYINTKISVDDTTKEVITFQNIENASQGTWPMVSGCGNNRGLTGGMDVYVTKFGDYLKHTCTVTSSQVQKAHLFVFIAAYDTDLVHDSTWCNAKLYSLQVYKNELLVANFIPCYCTSNVTDVNDRNCNTGTVGLYNTVNNEFYTNDGNGSFKKGNECYEYKSLGNVNKDGKYEIPITFVTEDGEENVVIELQEPLRKKDDTADYIDLIRGVVVRQIEDVDETESKNIAERFNILEEPLEEPITIEKDIDWDEVIDVIVNTDVEISKVEK